MLEHPYIIEKLKGYQEREIKIGLFGRIQSCIEKLLYSETEFTLERRMPSGDYQVQERNM
ncbi:hypothetical protein [Paenibacillus sp. GCM10012306]|uniref:hypothetical protein n=1 Tax=Paenibacillus sp. GCM10012306 TaxID=3317342 RepID=UPI0036166553